MQSYGALLSGGATLSGSNISSSTLKWCNTSYDGVTLNGGAIVSDGPTLSNASKSSANVKWYKTKLWCNTQ